MEGSVRSGGVLKKKTSSGCLIFRPKGNSSNSGGRYGDLGINGKEKKRPRLDVSDSSSSDDDETILRRKANAERVDKGSLGYNRNEVDNRNDFEVYGERKRNRLDLFDEYDGVSKKKMKKQYAEDRFNNAGRSYGVESSNRNLVVDKHREGPYHDHSGNEMVNKPIRLQGKNGVLKVMVNHKKKMPGPSLYKNSDLLQSNGRISIPMPFHPSGLKPPEKQGPFVNNEKAVKKQKKEINFETVKPLYSKDSRDDTPLKKVVVEEEKSSEAENVTPAKGKEGKAKKVGNTEKQMLREKIRGILMDAGWKIDYRPRRNREYLDSVYINPNGTAYWSIIKAYEAFKKQSEEENNKMQSDLGSPSFVPDDLVNKLTRQTKKKIAEELKRKSIEAGMVVKSPAKGNLSEAKSRKHGNQKHPRMSNSGHLQGRTTNINGRCTLLVRGSCKNSVGDGYVPYSGKRTLLAWLIDSGTAQLSEKVQYMSRKRTHVMLEGWITRDGIHCGCCSKILTVSKFELHAGSKLRQPFHNIYLESGASLLQCQIDAWNKQDESVRRDFHTVDPESEDADDDTCGICADGGDLICCDSCPSTFHQSCLEIQMLPSGDWHCPNCTCKFCGNASVEIAEERDNVIDKCCCCEKKYHKSCSEEVDNLPVASSGLSFCGLKCQELYEHLQRILGVRNELEGGFSWSLIQRTNVLDTHLQGYPQRVESNSKLAVALSVMDECFVPIIDRRSGINMIHNVVYNRGSNFNRLNYHGFYTAILERGDEIVSAASIRIHGTRLAEMPFIGTRVIYRRQGMCQRLLSSIETELRDLNVKQLVIPATSDHMKASGFCKLKDSLKKEIKSMNMLVFPGTDMLQKKLIRQEILEGLEVSASITRPPLLVNKPDIDSTMGHPGQMNEDSGVCLKIKTFIEKDVDSGSIKQGVISNDVQTPVDIVVNKGTDKLKSEVGKGDEDYTDSEKVENIDDDVKASDNTCKHVNESNILTSNQSAGKVNTEVEKVDENNTHFSLECCKSDIDDVKTPAQTSGEQDKGAGGVKTEVDSEEKDQGSCTHSASGNDDVKAPAEIVSEQGTAKVKTEVEKPDENCNSSPLEVSVSEHVPGSDDDVKAPAETLVREVDALISDKGTSEVENEEKNNENRTNSTLEVSGTEKVEGSEGPTMSAEASPMICNANVDGNAVKNESLCSSALQEAISREEVVSPNFATEDVARS